MSDWKLVEAGGTRLEAFLGEQPVFNYVYNPTTAPIEAPRPYFHPIRTLAGDVVTIFRPHDHRWHHGLSMAIADINGENFWGGVTYVHGQGYIQLDNVGRQEHRGWHAHDPLQRVESLAWITHDDQEWISEQRTLHPGEYDLESGWWTIDLRFALKNVSGKSLKIGSPTTNGRPKAGYGGLFWRGVRDLTGGNIMLSGERATSGDEDALMGERSQWAGFTGAHDVVDRASTVVMIDRPQNPRYPTQWFCRTGVFAALTTSFMFDAVYTLEPDAVLTLDYTVLIANGAWSAVQIQELIDERLKS